MNIDFPYHFDTRGRTAEEDFEAHIRDFNDQVRALFVWAVKPEFRKNALGQVEVTA